MPESPTPADLKRNNLAVRVLKEACPRCAHSQVGTTEVRLALRVLGPFVTQKWLVEFWEVATEEPRRPWRTCSTPFDAILVDLRKRGIVVEPELIPSRLTMP